MNFHCPHCNQINSINPAYAGQNLSCAICRQIFFVPSVGPQPYQAPIQQTVNIEIRNDEVGYRRRRSTVSRTAYILIGFFLGGFGFHNFYAGRTLVGILQLLMGLSVVGLLLSCLWSLIDIIFVKHDGQGLEMS